MSFKKLENIYFHCASNFILCVESALYRTKLASAEIKAISAHRSTTNTLISRTDGLRNRLNLFPSYCRGPRCGLAGEIWSPHLFLDGRWILEDNLHKMFLFYLICCSKIVVSFAGVTDLPKTFMHWEKANSNFIVRSLVWQYRIKKLAVMHGIEMSI